MANDDMNSKASTGESAEYEAVLMLEELESLLEDLEEYGDTERLPSDLQSRMETLGISNAAELRKRILELHAQLDEEDA
ncbi:MAG TPA: hypothetical protein VJ183_12775 [Chloroflexia bacterium]|nr:hypothetical protein [Chloroflexia bacterium]